MTALVVIGWYLCGRPTLYKINPFIRNKKIFPTIGLIFKKQLGIIAQFTKRGYFKMTLTKAELADILVEKVSRINKHDAKEIVELFFEEIRTTLERGEEIKISGFGNFQLRDKPQRPGRNPKTGEEVPITARRVVTFHASQKLKSMVNR